MKEKSSFWSIFAYLMAFLPFYRKFSLAKIIIANKKSPKQAAKMLRRGVKFSTFSEWRMAANQALVPGTNMNAWRALALKYPTKLVLRDLQLFLTEIDENTPLADQARARLFFIPAHRLPRFKQIDNLVSKTPAGRHVKYLLIKKKLLGEKKFLHDFFWSVVQKKENEQKITFSLASGRQVELLANFSEPTFGKRLNTLLGKGTFVADRKQFNEFSDDHHVFVLFDGDTAVRKIRPLVLKEAIAYKSIFN